MKIKVCGMRNKENIRELIQLNPDMIGFIFYPGSKRYIGKKIEQDIIKLIPKNIKKTGVFVDMAPGLLVDAAIASNLDLIQLHGDETPAYCKRLNQDGLQVMKAFRIEKNVDMTELNAYKPYCKYFLFDTQCKTYGGSGKQFNWEILEKYTGETPFFLSGGIGPEDANRVLNFNHPNLCGADLNSRFETAPAIKDIKKINAFINAINYSSK